MKHAPGQEVDIDVSAETTTLAVSVRNPVDGLLRATDSINGRVPNSAAGEADPSADPEVRHRGLVNMRERAAALGGSFTAGPASGGWEVLARLPLSTSAVS
jgi:signal transduction histidine kinase